MAFLLYKRTYWTFKLLILGIDYKDPLSWTVPPPIREGLPHHNRGAGVQKSLYSGLGRCFIRVKIPACYVGHQVAIADEVDVEKIKETMEKVNQSFQEVSMRMYSEAQTSTETTEQTEDGEVTDVDFEEVEAK